MEEFTKAVASYGICSLCGYFCVDKCKLEKSVVINAPTGCTKFELVRERGHDLQGVGINAVAHNRVQDKLREFKYILTHIESL